MTILQLKEAYTVDVGALDGFLQQRGFKEVEGHSGGTEKQKERLQRLCQKAKTILEIGFNAGHSSFLFLSSSQSQVISFDLNAHPYVSFAKKYIDQHFPKRHELILGNSLQTIPLYIYKNKGKTFDLIFIDGGHEEKVAKLDLQNCRKLAHPNTIVVMDDVVSQAHLHKHYTLGPTKAWEEAVQQKWLRTLGQENYGIGRGMIWGQYLIF